jgi:hypothetical protein
MPSRAVDSVRTLPIFFGDSYSACTGVVLFPDDLQKARSYSARHLADGRLVQYRQLTGDVPPFTDDLMALLGRRPVGDADIVDRHERGMAVGLIVSLLWALVTAKDPRAGWSAALKLAMSGRFGPSPGSLSKLKTQLRLFAPVLHFWGAWHMRGSRFVADASDLDTFMAEAADLLGGLRTWRDGLAVVSHKPELEYLAADEFGPWYGWRRPNAVALLAPPALAVSDLATLKGPGTPSRKVRR